MNLSFKKVHTKSIKNAKITILYNDLTIDDVSGRNGQ